MRGGNTGQGRAPPRGHEEVVLEQAGFATGVTRGAAVGTDFSRRLRLRLVAGQEGGHGTDHGGVAQHASMAEAFRLEQPRSRPGGGDGRSVHGAHLAVVAVVHDEERRRAR